jgi:hypothetical protein
MTISPLRIALYVLTGLLALAAVVLLLTGCTRAAAVVPGVWAVLLFIGLALERWRYKPLTSQAPGFGWAATDERFVDPETGKMVAVYFNAATGERRYIGR